MTPMPRSCARGSAGLGGSKEIGPIADAGASSADQLFQRAVHGRGMDHAAVLGEQGLQPGQPARSAPGSSPMSRVSHVPRPRASMRSPLLGKLCITGCAGARLRCAVLASAAASRLNMRCAHVSLRRNFACGSFWLRRNFAFGSFWLRRNFACGSFSRILRSGRAVLIPLAGLCRVFLGVARRRERLPQWPMAAVLRWRRGRPWLAGSRAAGSCRGWLSAESRPLWHASHASV